MTKENQGHTNFDLLKTLRELQPAQQKVKMRAHTLGQKVADKVADTVGSWPFIIIQSIILVCWLLLNVYGWVQSWDPYPFILLNLMLSFQAAYSAPIIMMSQNRQSSLDRERAEKDYNVNLKSELEIELLHQKFDQLKDQEIRQLTEMVQKLMDDRDLQK